MFKKMLLILLVLMTLTSAQSVKEKIHNYLESKYASEYFNGTVAISKNGEKFFSGAYGVSDIKANKKLKTSTPFKIASVSKQFTALVIMLLIEDGKISMDDEVQKFFPELSYKGLKVSHLLGFTNGLPNAIRLLEKHWQPEIKDVTKRKAIHTENVIPIYAKYNPPLVSVPGENYSYTNVGYIFLAAIAEKVTSKKIGELLNEMIFEPLNMKNSFACTKQNVKNKNPVAIGYSKNSSGEIKISDNTFYDSLVGAWGIFSSSEDFIKYDRALLECKLISKAKFDSYITGTKLNNGGTVAHNYGWHIAKSMTGKIKHWTDGGWGNFRSFFNRLPEDGYSITILTNNDCPSVVRMGLAIEAILCGDLKSGVQLFSKTINSDDVNVNIEEIQKTFKTQKSKYYFSEMEFINLGYTYFREKDFAKAITVFEISTVLFSESPNTFDSLGEAFLASGNKEASILNYKKALELDPYFPSAKAALIKMGVKIVDDERINKK